MTIDEPYRDPDGPIHAVLAAANTVAPRCHLPDGVSLVHARYQYPACVPEGTTADVKAATDRYRGVAQRMWDAVTGRGDTQRDYLGVQ